MGLARGVSARTVSRLGVRSVHASCRKGGGDREVGHRCPGDRFSAEITKAAVKFLTEDIRYDVPPQDLSLEMTHMPALPRSRFVIRNVRPA